MNATRLTDASPYGSFGRSPPRTYFVSSFVSGITIFDGIVITIQRVRQHLFQKFDLADLPQNQNRARLVEFAFRWGLVSDRDL